MIAKCTRRTFAVCGLVALLALVFGSFLGPLGARADMPVDNFVLKFEKP